MKETWIRPFFLLAAAYDGVLGIAFILAPGSIFAMYGVEPPNHMAYVQFPAMLLILFAIMFYRIAMDPVRNRDLILYGCGLKIAYCSLAFWYMFTTGIPSMWVPWAYADLVFLVLFILSWKSIGARPQPV
jgi:hypothetical protein